MNILIASPIDPEAIEELHKQYTVVCAFDATPPELQKCIQGCEILIFRSGVKITREVMESSPELQLIIRAGSGIDNIDIDYVHERRLKLVRIPEPGARAVAEMSFALMLALSRSIFLADRMTREGHWIKHEIEGFLLAKKVLGIIGLGNIGSKVAELGLSWDMEVIGCVEHPSQERADEFQARGIQLVSFEEVISRSDYISIHVPMKESTRNLINAGVLDQMKPGVYLINLARGGVVDEEALLKAMSNGGRVRGAALDVHKQEGEGKASPFADMPNIILTPHIGAMTIDTQREIGCRIIEEVHLFEENCVQTKIQLTDSLAV